MFRFNKLLFKQFLFDSVNFAVLILMALSLWAAPSEESALDLRRQIVTFGSLVFGGVVLSFFCHLQKIVSLGAKLFSVPVKNPRLSRLWFWQLLLTLLVALGVGARLTELSLFELLNQDGFASAHNLFTGLLDPDWSLLPVAVMKVVETIFIAFMATILAVPVAFLLAFFTAKNLMTHPFAFALYSLLRIFFNIVRSVEPIIWVIIFAVWVGIGPFAGMLALMVQSIASLTKQYSELIESAHPGPLESIAATGANRIQTIWFGLVPQVLLPYISFTIYRWDTNVRMATIIGFAGGGGIGTLLYQYSMRAQWAQVSCLIFVIAAVVWVLDVLSAYIREALK